MNISVYNTITEIIALDNRTTCIFETYGIDYNTKGDRTLIEVCENRNINLEVLIESLQTLILSNKVFHDFSSWPADLLVEYIEKKHHRYVEETIPRIEAFLNKIASTHRLNHPELEEIKKLFGYIATDLKEQMEMEETILFLYIRKMVQTVFLGKFPELASLGTIVNLIAALYKSHDMELGCIKRISLLSKNYSLPSDACDMYKQTMELLKEFQDDLIIHFHLENNILFPKMLELERQFQIDV